MQYEERYEVQRREGAEWVTLGIHDNQEDAEYGMGMSSWGESGYWRVVRAMEVTVALVSKAAR